jgi:hypothetical protein
MSWFSQFMSGNNPADPAQGPLNEAKDVVSNGYNPYIQQGMDAYNTNKGPLDKMTSDPSGFINELMKNYQQSGDFDLRRKEMMKTAGASAAAGGYRGNYDDVMNQTHLTDSLLGDDMQKWLGNVLGRQDAGIAGNQHIYDQGFNANTNKTNDLANILGTQSTLNFQGQANKNQSFNDVLKSILGGAATIGGSIFGGPIGGAIGTALGSYLGNPATGGK